MFPHLQGTGGVPSLVAPTSLGTASLNVGGISLESGAFAPQPGSLIALRVHSRDNTAAHCQLASIGSSGLTWDGSWRIIQPDPAATDTDDGNYVGAAIALRRVLSGSGTVTPTYAASVFQITLDILEIPYGFDPATIGSYPTVTNTGETTSLALNFGSPPSSDSLIITTLGEHGAVAGAYTIPSGHTALTRVQAGSNLDSKGSYKLLSGAQNNSWAGLDASEANAGVAVEILQVS